MMIDTGQRKTKQSNRRIMNVYVNGPGNRSERYSEMKSMKIFLIGGKNGIYRVKGHPGYPRKHWYIVMDLGTAQP